MKNKNITMFSRQQVKDLKHASALMSQMQPLLPSLLLPRFDESVANVNSSRVVATTCSLPPAQKERRDTQESDHDEKQQDPKATQVDKKKDELRALSGKLLTVINRFCVEGCASSQFNRQHYTLYIGVLQSAAKHYEPYVFRLLFTQVPVILRQDLFALLVMSVNEDSECNDSTRDCVLSIDAGLFHHVVLGERRWNEKTQGICKRYLMNILPRVDESMYTVFVLLEELYFNRRFGFGDKNQGFLCWMVNQCKISPKIILAWLAKSKKKNYTATINDIQLLLEINEIALVELYIGHVSLRQLLHGLNVLHRCVDNDNPKMLHCFLRCDADVSERDTESRDVFDYALEKKKIKMAMAVIVHADVAKHRRCDWIKKLFVSLAKDTLQDHTAALTDLWGMCQKLNVGFQGDSEAFACKPLWLWLLVDLKLDPQLLLGFVRQDVSRVNFDSVILFLCNQEDTQYDAMVINLLKLIPRRRPLITRCYLDTANTALHCAVLHGKFTIAGELSKHIEGREAFSLNHAGQSPMSLAIAKRQYTLALQLLDVNRCVLKEKLEWRQYLNELSSSDGDDLSEDENSARSALLKCFFWQCYTDCSSRSESVFRRQPTVLTGAMVSRLFSPEDLVCYMQSADFRVNFYTVSSDILTISDFEFTDYDEVLCVLLKKVSGRQVSWYQYADTGDSPLHCAVLRGKQDIAMALCGAGCSPLLKNAAGQNTIMLALAEGNYHLAQKLLQSSRPDISDLESIVDVFLQGASQRVYADNRSCRTFYQTLMLFLLEISRQHNDSVSEQEETIFDGLVSAIEVDFTALALSWTTSTLSALIFHLCARQDNRYDETVVQLLEQLDDLTFFPNEIHSARNGLLILHYAILNNKVAVVNKLMSLGFSVLQRTQNSGLDAECFASYTGCCFDVYWPLYRAKYDNDICAAATRFVGGGVSDFSRLYFFSSELALQVMQAGLSVDAGQIKLDALAGCDFSTCVIYPPASVESYKKKGVADQFLPQQGCFVRSDNDLETVQGDHIRFSQEYVVASVEALRILQKKGIPLTRFKIHESVELKGFTLSDFNLGQLTAAQYYQLLMPTNPQLCNSQGAACHMFRLSSEPNKKIADYTNGELLIFRKGLEFILQKLQCDTDKQQVHRHIQLIDRQFRSAVQLNHVQELFSSRQVQEIFSRSERRGFFYRPVVIEKVPAVSKGMQAVLSCHDMSQDELCELLWQMVKAYNNYLQEHQDESYLQNPLNPANRVFFLLTWMLAHISTYPLESMLLEDELGEMGVQQSPLDEVSVGECAVLSRGQGTVLFADLERNLRETAKLVYYDKELALHDIPACDWSDVFIAFPGLIAVVHDCHRKDLKENRIKPLPDELIDVIEKYGELFANNSFDKLKGSHFLWQGKRYPVGVFDEALSVELQAGFQREVEAFPEADRAALDSVEIYVESRNCKTTFNQLWSEMTYRGCSGQFGFAMIQYAQGYRRRVAENSIKTTAYSCYLPSCAQAQRSQQLGDARFFPKPGFDNHERAVTQALMVTAKT